MDFLGRLHYLVQQWIHVYGRLWSIFSIFYVEVDSNPEAFFSIRLNGEVSTVDASGCSLFSAACTSKSGHYFYKCFFFDSLQHFRRSWRPFFGLLFEVEALPVIDYGAVDIHTFIDSSEQHTNTHKHTTHNTQTRKHANTQPTPTNPPTPTNTHQHPPTPTNTHQHPPTPTNTHQHPPTPTDTHQHPPTPNTNNTQHQQTHNTNKHHKHQQTHNTQHITHNTQHITHNTQPNKHTTKQTHKHTHTSAI